MGHLPFEIEIVSVSVGNLKFLTISSILCGNTQRKSSVYRLGRDRLISPF